MLSRPQQIMLKRAQAAAGLTDDEYRDAIETVSALPDCRSSKDPRLTDRHMDRLMGYFEAIHWRGVDSGALQPSSKPNAIFRQRGFWASRNPAGNTTRDRYAASSVEAEIAMMEAELSQLGFGFGYLAAIRSNIYPFSKMNYCAALRRTLAAKRRKAENAAATVLAPENQPF